VTFWVDLKLDKSAEDFGQALGEGLVMGAHRLVDFKRSPKKCSLKKVIIQSSKEVSRGAKTGVIVGEGNTFARRLQDTPANKMRPKGYGRRGS
jgi:leucyl aminopeptidase